MTAGNRDPRDLSLISLREAVSKYQAESGAPGNAYDWYRRSAQRYGSVSIGPGEIATQKIKNAWHVSRADLAVAIEAHRETRALLQQRTTDFEANILHGIDGDTIYTEFGGYRRHGQFHFVWSNYDIGTKRSNGSWYCSTCFRPARVAHNKEECHRCRDWGSCGRDCTASGVACVYCEVAMNL
jgi:hypothetical protein